ncbi:proline-rich receptor-like protein kinase PERK8 [Phalaenopsis equestris]|uniref:proline-rich receptor-like protein kinase PERK8 n=1 Tax=Phalaenopsis equestris TaxID=78828 RepID=UPI0009E4701E|nr:proline-rich receptor-like protein kinase PERK8 [Phalaenopsis equestris]
MGCCPLGKKFSKAFGKCSGKEERRSISRAVKLSPPPAYLYSRPTTTLIKSVNFSNDTHTPIVIIPPDPNPPKPRPVENPAHQHPMSTTTATTSAAAAAATSAPAKPVPIAEPSHVVSSPATGPVQKQPGPVQRGPPHCYVMSPLPRWEERPPRRREYLSGEYSYYPTPIREGIYNIGTDPNRLTSIFSEENPNACTIV